MDEPKAVALLEELIWLAEDVPRGGWLKIWVSSETLDKMIAAVAELKAPSPRQGHIDHPVV
jgi:hypothetical protein